jgi:hypothetical protein
MKAIFATAVLLALGACADRPTTVADAKPQPVVRCDSIVPVGSRLAKCTNDRLRHTIGTQDAQDDARRVPSISDRIGGRSN